VVDVYVFSLGLEDEEPSKRRRVQDDIAQNQVEVDADDVGPSLLESADGLCSGPHKSTN